LTKAAAGSVHRRRAEPVGVVQRHGDVRRRDPGAVRGADPQAARDEDQQHHAEAAEQLADRHQRRAQPRKPTTVSTLKIGAHQAPNSSCLMSVGLLSTRFLPRSGP